MAGKINESLQDLQFQQNQSNQSKQDFGINPSRYREFNFERLNAQREAARLVEELERERRRAREEDARRAAIGRGDDAILRGNQFHRELLDSMKTPKQTSQKELAIEKLSIKFCFVSNRLMVLKTLAALGVIKNQFENKSESELLKKVFESVVAEGGRSGISREEISKSIINVSTKLAEGYVGDSFVNHFLGLAALNVFKTNPDIIKDVKPKVKDSLHKYETAFEELNTGDIMRLIREMTSEERMRNIEGRAGRNDMQIIDYSSLITNDKPQIPLRNWLQYLDGTWQL